MPQTMRPLDCKLPAGPMPGRHQGATHRAGGCKKGLVEQVAVLVNSGQCCSQRVLRELMLPPVHGVGALAPCNVFIVTVALIPLR